MRTRPALLTLSIALVALFACTGVGWAHGGSPKVKAVATGLDNPRGVTIGHDGSVYVAEAGSGGDGPCIPGPEPGADVCVGATGAVTKIRHRHQRQVVTGLPSIAGDGGAEALGPSDVALRRFGGAYVTVGLGADPAARAKLGDVGAGLGKLYKVSRFGGVRAVADIAGFEAANNPDGGVADSNPNSVLVRHGHKIVVVDAGGKDVLRVRRNGAVSTLAVFPVQENVPQPVPTAVAVGPDGALYVSQLVGFPFPVGAAKIFRIVPGSEPEVFAEGLTNVTDLAFDRRGNLYVVEIAANGLMSGPPGALIKIRPDGSQETIASDGLVFPYGVAVDRKGDILVSNHSVEAGTGEVLRIRGSHRH